MCWEKLRSSICVLIWSDAVRIMNSPVVLISWTHVGLISVKSILDEGLIADTVATLAMASPVVAGWASVRTSGLEAIKMRETAFSRFPGCSCCSLCVVMCAVEFMSSGCLMRSLLGKVVRWGPCAVHTMSLRMWVRFNKVTVRWWSVLDEIVETVWFFIVLLWHGTMVNIMSVRV